MSNPELAESTPLLPLNWERLLQGFLDILSVDSYWGNEDRGGGDHPAAAGGRGGGVPAGRHWEPDLSLAGQGQGLAADHAERAHGHGAADAGDDAGGEGGRGVLRRV